jgi:hypothetical protein
VVIRINVPFTFVYVHWHFTYLHFTFLLTEEKITTFHNYVCVTDGLN